MAVIEAERNSRPDALVDLLLHREAFRVIETNPRLRSSANDILRRLTASGAQPWSSALAQSAWSEVLADTESGAKLRRHSQLAAVLPASLRAAVAEAVRASGARTLAELAPVELQRAKAFAVVEELRSMGVVAEVFGSLVWGQWDPCRSDVDILVLARGRATPGVIEDAANLFVGPRVDVVYLDQLRDPSRDYLLQQRQVHGLPELGAPVEALSTSPSPLKKDLP